MRVLITRTAEDGAATARALQALGHQPVMAPLRERMLLDAPLPEGPFEAVLATSRHAFSGDAFSGLPGELSALPCFCVGETTARAARAAGFARIDAVAGDGAALATALLAQLQPGARLLYLAGQPRHPALEAALAAGGITPQISERYGMRRLETLPEIARAALASAGIDAVMHYSAQSAHAYLELATQARLESAALAPVQLCLSGAVAAIFEGKVPPSRLRIARQANEAAMLEQLVP